MWRAHATGLATSSGIDSDILDLLNVARTEDGVDREKSSTEQSANPARMISPRLLRLILAVNYGHRKYACCVNNTLPKHFIRA